MPRIKIEKKEELKKLTAELPSTILDLLTKYVDYTAQGNGITDMKINEVQTIVLKEMIQDFISKDKEFNNYDSKIKG